MLPLQITLDGFMSYRDKATISFEGASLWMLAGNNGAGKSSVFDAMRWMLFNRHRGGAQGHEALIHHDKAKLRVAFDLEIASGRFRLMRTLARGGKSSWQIEKLTAHGTEKVPETDMRDGYNRWLSENIGLSDETFGAAFYLAQGRGDAILSAKPEERYEMLAEIVDLSAFQRLHERAKSASVELESAARLARLQFEAAPGAEQDVIVENREKLAALSLHLGDLARQIAAGADAEPWAKQWQSLHLRRGELETELEQGRQLLGDAAQIERDAARLSELETVLPPLENWLEQRARLAQNRREREQSRAQVEAAFARRSALLDALDAAQTRRDELEAARQNHEAAQLAALTRQNELAPQETLAQTLETGRARIADLQTQLRAFPADLETQKTALETQISSAKASANALSSLRRFDRERAAWRRAQSDSEIARAKAQQLGDARPALETQLENDAAQLGAARDRWTQALETLAAAQARLADATSAVQRFDAVKNEPNCHFCGQKLTLQHAAREALRLEQAAQNAQDAVEAAQIALDKAKTALDEQQTVLEAAQTAINLNRNDLQRAAQDLKSAETTAHQAARQAAEALRELDANFAARFEMNDSRAWNEPQVAAALRGDFPTSTDLEALQSDAELLSSSEVELEFVAQQLSAQGKIVAQLEAVETQIEPLRAHFDDAALLRLREETQALQEALSAARRALQSGQKPLQTARDEVVKASKALESAREVVAQGETKLAGLDAALVEIERALNQFQADHEALREHFERDEIGLRADVLRWREEKSELESGDLGARRDALQQARERVSLLENEMAGVELSLQQVPNAARRAPEVLREEIAALRREADAKNEEQRATEVELARLERLLEEKNALQEALLDVETRARQHKTLSDLLGPQQLQRFLLREAENGIVDEANAVLDRISSGSLRLELRADDDEVVGARKVAPKVLDVAVYQDGGEGTARAMLPAFLSGSQRFRVAVALALGIGRFATRGQGHSKLESVIIDEGFGSLDKVGRGEMIDELKALGEELKRVILVSHQEEFADAFPNRYLIEHDGTASTARLMVG